MTLAALWTWIPAHWAQIGIAVVAALKAAQLIVGALLVFWPGSAGLKKIKAGLDELAVSLPKSWLPSSGAAPAVVKVLFLGALLAAVPAHAQVVSSGPSLPMLEFQPGATHPVAFAPGIGYDLSVGFFQRSLLGKQFDLLDLSVQGFGSATQAPNGDPAGSFQVAALVGTLNNVIALGVAVPLFGGPQGGAFQGSWHAYPVLSLTLPIAFGPYSPPTGIAEGAAGLPRGATIYLP